MRKIILVLLILAFWLCISVNEIFAGVYIDGKPKKIEALDLEGRTSDPASPMDGQIWYRSDLGEYRGRANGLTYRIKLL